MEMHDIDHNRNADLDPFFFSEFRWQGVTLKPTNAAGFTLRPEMDESGQLLRCVHEDIGLDVHAYTRDELEEAIHGQVVFLWNTYAKGDPQRMTERARRLRQRLLSLLQEAPLRATR